jgi:hypothetical protein
MSVYNFTGDGIWSKLSPVEQAITVDKARYICNKTLGYRHDDFFTSRTSRPKILKRMKKIFGMKLGWRIYMLRAILIIRKLS